MGSQPNPPNKNGCACAWCLLHVSLKSLSKNGFTSPACDGLPPNKLATAEKRLAASSAFGVQFTTQTLSEVDGGWFLAGVEKH